ncbi:MAG: tRNA pseudouridine(38-40) synthase TruA [Candidatus Babeliales bacterium]|jgi:tRNA pseudouridine38-40 synthase
MQAYKIIVAYDGTDFHGWQIQPHNITITSCLQDTWYRIFKQNITIVGASRTDAGVHALGQVARFYADAPASLTDQQLQALWNAHLPCSVSIRFLCKTEHFHPCANVRQKTYYYTLFLKRPLPFVARFGWHYALSDRVDLKKFSDALTLYHGTHDFGSFCKIEDEATCTTVRTIDEIRLKHLRHYNALLVVIKGKSFARFQIRRMIGYALDIARRPSLDIDYISDMLQHPNPQQTLLKADGCGLCLRKVIYHHDK